MNLLWLKTAVLTPKICRLCGASWQAERRWAASKRPDLPSVAFPACNRLCSNRQKAKLGNPGGFGYIGRCTVWPWQLHLENRKGWGGGIVGGEGLGSPRTSLYLCVVSLSFTNDIHTSILLATTPWTNYCLLHFTEGQSQVSKVI
jgi:hypothetical protein